MSAPIHMMLKITDVSYDFDNPRIKRYIEQYGEGIEPEHFYLALGSSSKEVIMVA